MPDRPAAALTPKTPATTPATTPAATPAATLAIAEAAALDRRGFAALGVPFPQARTWLLHGPGGRPSAAAMMMPGPPPSLRLSAIGDGPTGAGIHRLETLARALGADEIRTQGKLAETSPLAKRLLAHGYAPGAPSEVFDVAVERAVPLVARCAGLAERLGGAARVASLTRATLGQVGDALHRAELLDDLELTGRLEMAGPGHVDPAECPVLIAPGRVLGVVLVARTEMRDTREIVARWVAPHLQRTLVANFVLVHAALELARKAGVCRVRFAANPSRHAETIALARRFSGRWAGTRRGLSKCLGGHRNG